jgi:hypothetical protein
MTPNKAVKFIIISNFISLIGFTIKMFLQCPNPEWATEMTLDK